MKSKKPLEALFDKCYRKAQEIMIKALSHEHPVI